MFAVILLHVNLWSQNRAEPPTTIVSGIVKDQATGERIPYATIGIKGLPLGTETNADGYFTLLDVPSNADTLVIHHLGYQIKELPIPERKTDLIIELIEESLVLDEVLVSSVHEDQMIKASSGISRIGITPDALSVLPSYGEKDIFRSLQLLPGISGSNESSSGLFVRGGTPDQNLILFDGFTVYHVDHLFGFFSAFNANAIKDIQLHKGGFGAEFGGRLSSVVEMTGKDGNSEKVSAGAGISMLSYNGYLEIPFASSKGSFLVAGRKSFQSNFYRNIFDSFSGNAQPNNPAGAAPGRVGPGRGGLQAQQAVSPNSFFYDLNAKLSYRFSKNDQLSISLYNGEDDLDNSRTLDSNSGGITFGRRPGGPGGGNQNLTFSSESTDLSNWGNIGSSVRYARKWSDRFFTTANASFSNYFSDRDRSNVLTINREDTTIQRNTGSIETNDLEDRSLRIDNEFKLNARNVIDFGWNYSNLDIKYDFIQNDTVSIIGRDDRGSTFATYLQDKWTFNDVLILTGGIRSTLYSVTNKWYWEPRLALTYLLNDRIKLKGAYGNYYQFANRIVREDIQQGSRDFWLLSNDGIIPVSSAQHFIAGISHETKNFLFDIEGYYKPLDGLTEYSSRVAPRGRGRDRTLTYEESFFVGDGVAQGIELLLQKKTGKFNGWISYTLGQVKYNFDAFGTDPFFANQDQTHELKTIFNYRLGPVDLAATFIYSTGRPYTAPTGYYEIELIDGSSESYFEVSSKNSLRFPDYHRFDLSGTYNFKLAGTKCKLGLSLINLYDRSNVWYKEYEVIEGDLLVTDISLIDFTPSVFFSWDLN